MRHWSLSDLALQRPVTLGMALLAVLLLGFIGVQRMPLSFLPLNQAPRMFVRVNIDTTSPEVLERDVIRPIEAQVAGIRDLKRIQVGSGSWGVRINLDFEPGTDVDARKIELRDRIERARGELPEFVRSLEIGSYTNFDDPVMELMLSSGTDLSQDYYLIEERIVRKIERIRGVSRVEVNGVSPHELEVAVDLESARRAGISLQELGDAVRDARQGRSLGMLRNDQRSPSVRSPAVDATPESFAELRLRRGRAAEMAPATEPGVTTSNPPATPPATGSTPVPTSPPVTSPASPSPGTQPTTASSPALPLAAQIAPQIDPQIGPSFAELGEVAKVDAHPQEERWGKRLNGRQAIGLEIFASAGVSAVDVSRAIVAELETLEDDPALDGVEFLVVEDQGETIVQTLGDLRNTGIYGGLLGIAVLFAFLHRLSTTFAAAVSIPLSVMAACAALFLRGEELNCVVMLGLVLGVGMLIDNAVVMVEAIAQHLQMGKTSLLAARDGAREVGFATLASTLSTVIVFIPLVATESTDEMMIYLRPLGMTFAICLLASLFVSQTAVPLLMGRLIKVRPRNLRTPMLDAVTRAYGWIIDRTLKFPRLTILVGLALAASAVYPATHLNLRFGRAEFKPDHLPIRMQIAGSRGYETIGETVKVLDEALLAKQDELAIESISCSWSDHWANCRVYPSIAFESEADVEAFQSDIKDHLPEQLGIEYRLGEREFDWRENQDRNVVEFAIKGEDMGELMRIAGAVADHLRSNLPKGDRDAPDRGGYDVITTPFDEGARELHVHLDGERLQRLGLKPDDVARQVSLAFQGLPLGKVRGERGELALRLSTGKADAERGIELLRDLRLTVAGGREVPLSSVSEIELARRPWWIQRVDRQTEVRLQVRFFQPDPQANWKVVSEAMETFVFPNGYGWGRGTQWRTEAEASNEMLVNLLLCLLLVYAVMASLFESFLQPMGILVTCLLGCFGAPWALWATGTTLDTTAVVGMFILIGVVVNNGIMLVDKVTQLRRQGVPRAEALRQSGRDRLRPILMTVTTTVLGLVPMIIHHPTLAGVYYHAIAIVIAGGLVTSTFVTLLFLPAAYTLIEGYSNSARRAWSRGLGRRS